MEFQEGLYHPIPSIPILWSQRSVNPLLNHCFLGGITAIKKERPQMAGFWMLLELVSKWIDG
jgi:hypothetical protein